ncbi:MULTISPECIES: 3-hydroxyacyl-ACP dehydratase FabZ family protein [unclassified Lentilitoribacter]|jgi:3-hydroxyacyl-[acyl-carrier-protein] dehydratase|uniref:3-hydroxyacyl-ACP dehydratase FabZ family protein n=1 Tax=unclassified Lentilitoribacter TaxID=2647570 RepID=UPI0013A6A21F|nr:3-hydroxyacyl-ACP dehydratase FabZ family protein [Lentilitoribacter sp. Alg239-R112]
MQLEYFQMLDHVEAIDLSAKTISMRSTVPKESPVFEGHFPGLPLVPGVLLIETMAQSVGLLVIAVTDFKIMPFLMSVDNAKMRMFVEPETVLDIKAQIEHEGSGFIVAKTSITTAGKRVCNAQLKFKTRSFEELPFLDNVLGSAEKLGLHEAIAAQQT